MAIAGIVLHWRSPKAWPEALALGSAPPGACACWRDSMAVPHSILERQAAHLCVPLSEIPARPWVYCLKPKPFAILQARSRRSVAGEDIMLDPRAGIRRAGALPPLLALLREVVEVRLHYFK